MVMSPWLPSNLLYFQLGMRWARSWARAAQCVTTVPSYPAPPLPVTTQSPPALQGVPISRNPAYRVFQLAGTLLAGDWWDSLLSRSLPGHPHDVTTPEPRPAQVCAQCGVQIQDYQTDRLLIMYSIHFNFEWLPLIEESVIYKMQYNSILSS